MTPEEILKRDQESLLFYIESSLISDTPSKWYRETWGFIQSMNKVKPVYEENELKDIFENMAAERKRLLDEQAKKPVDPEEELQKLFLKDKLKGTYQLAQYLVSKYNMITIGSKYRETYIYQDGQYILAENLIIYPEIQRILGHHTTKNAKTETMHKIQDATSKPDDIFSTTDINLIPLKNGVYNIQTKVLTPHDPKYLFKYQFPIIYNQQALCPKTEAFFDQVLTPDQRATMEEWIGYYFYRNYMFKKALIMVGEGDTGKTTLLEVISHLLGPDNTSSVSLHKMTADRFAGSQLYEKHGNIVDELSAKDITDTGNFKIATGNGSITGEYKFGNQFSFVNYSKFTFACNRIPDVQDMDDDAYFNRWMVINFEKTITDKVLNFIETLKTEEERSGLFNLAMRGLDRLLTNKHFTYAKTGIDTKAEMMKNGSSIARFARDKLQEQTGSTITNEDMYKEYSDFCSDNDIRCETQTALGSKLEGYVKYIKKAQVYDIRSGKTVQVRGWRNVSVIPSDEELSEREDVNEMLKKTEDIIKKQVDNVIDNVVDNDKL